MTRKILDRENFLAWVLLFPLFVLIFMFYIFPVVQNIWLSFTNYSGLNLENYTFVGFSNYKDIFGNGLQDFGGLLLWTALFACCVTTLSFLLGAIIAVMLDNCGVVIAKIYRGIFILPWVIPAIVSLLMWKGLLNSGGVINLLLAQAGLPAAGWLTTPFYARLCSILVMTWFSFPYFIIVIQGILKAIPDSYYEAALVDGAGAVRRFAHITLPLVFRSALPTLILSFIMQFNQFGVYMLTSGGPPSDKLGAPGSTDLLITWVFNTAFNIFRYDYAAAYAVIIFFFTAAFALVSLRAGKRIGNENE